MKIGQIGLGHIGVHFGTRLPAADHEPDLPVCRRPTTEA